MQACPHCKRENRDDARFCDSCGAALAPSTAPLEERKVVSVLFADLVGSTGTAERLDPEDVRALQEPYWQHVRAELERHGGTVEKFIGDAVVALFGAPTAHEDDPERAVRAALAIRDWARDQDRVHVRIGVTTGEALVRLGAQPLAGEGMASGDVVNTAARLQTAAPTNAVLVDETTRRATRETIEFADVDPVAAKGKAEPVRAWEALEARSRFGVDLFQHARTPLVGRQLEVDVVSGALRRVREERSPQLVTLVGVPGIGKSRMVYELMQTIAEDPTAIVTWRQGRSLPYGDGVSFWALAEIVKAQAGVLETDTDVEAHAKLVRAVYGLVDDPVEAEWVEGHLRPLVGVAASASAADANDTERFAAWRRFFEALADRRPTVIVFEDLHWADDALLDFVDGLVEHVPDVPLLIVGTTRPELLDRRPTWGGGKANATTLSLAPLSSDETLELVRAFAELRPLPPDAEQTVVERAAGNALYAEQYVQMFEELEDAEEFRLPETVQGLIAARLDGLSSDEKGVLQNAAVFGKVFWQGAVVAVDGIEDAAAADCLHSLQRKQFVQRARRSSVQGESEYAFRHVLVRDVAYAQIPRARRSDKHRRAAAWIESLGRPDDHAEMLAHHHVSALEVAGPDDADDLAERAVRSLIRAGERATAVNAHASSASYYAHALQLLGEDDDRRSGVVYRHARAVFTTGDQRRERVLEESLQALLDVDEAEFAAEVATLLADAAWHQGRRSETDERLNLATALVAERPDSPSKAAVLASVARFRMLADELDAAIAAGRAAIDMAERFGLDEIRAQALISVGTARYEAGDDGGPGDIERGVEIALRSNQLSAAGRGYTNLAHVTTDIRRSLELQEEAERLWLRLGDIEGSRYPGASRAVSLFVLGRWDEALPLLDAFIEDCESGRPHYQEAWVRVCRAWARYARDDPDGALGDVERAVALARSAKDPQVVFGVLGQAAYVYTKLDRLDEAKRLAEVMIAMDPLAPRWGPGFGLLLVADRLDLRDAVRRAFEDDYGGHRPEPYLAVAAESRFDEAADIAEDIGEIEVEAELRCAAAEAFFAEGRTIEAADQLERALEFFRSVRATRLIRELEAQLETIRATVR